MASEKILTQKKQMVADLTEKIQAAPAGVIVNYSGITVADDTALRAALRKAGVNYSVYKNSITGRACEAAGYADLTKVLEGMTAIAVATDDPVAPAKILKEYADKIESFQILAGYCDGEVLDAAGINSLADIPSKEVLIAKFLGSIKSPIYNLAYALQAVVDKKNEGGEEEAPAAEEAAPAAEAEAPAAE